jgi:hypothetical protein
MRMSRSRTTGSAFGYAVAKRWNLLSLPVAVADARVSSLFPWATVPAYRYAGASGYAPAESLEAGVGYWVRSDSARMISIDGTARGSDTLHVSAGWNLVGSISLPVAAADIRSNPPGMATSRFFGYQGAYAFADTVLPARAYWVKADQDGELILGALLGQGSTSARIRLLLAGDDLPPPPGGDVDLSAARPGGELELRQNYPNPFNSQTVISYVVPAAAQVRLALYNILGEEIAVLVDEREDAGLRSVSFGVEGLPSGMYTYTLTVGNAATGRKMMLIR